MSGGLRTSVKGYLIAQRLNLATEPLSENETTSNNVTAPLDPPSQPVEEMTLDSGAYGLGICDGNIPCFPILSSTAKNLALYGTRSAERPPHQGVNLNSNMLSVSVSSSPQTEGEILHSFNLKSFHYDELKSTSRNFHRDSVVGRGGFGYVYKGWINKHSLIPAKPGEGMAIAIRRLNQPMKPLESHVEWSKKFNSLGQLSHPNLVKLIGYCINRNDYTHTRFLVYEFMPQGSLADHLFRIACSLGIHKFPKSGASHFKMLSWNLRMRIALGAAKGLAFLHSDKANVIFVDFQTSKVLLDSNHNVKLCGYAPAKERLGHYRRQLIHVDEICLSEDEQCRDAYTAPEYWSFGEDSLTSKSDMYSFGIFLLEILSSRRAFDKDFPSVLSDHSELLILASANVSSEHKVVRIFDTRLEGQYSLSGAVKAVDLAIKCLSKEPTSRPDMYQVIEILEELQSCSE